jgi:hypothetical protein
MTLPGGAAPTVPGASPPLIWTAQWPRSPSTALRRKGLKSTAVPTVEVEGPNVRARLLAAPSQTSGDGPPHAVIH